MANLGRLRRPNTESQKWSRLRSREQKRNSLELEERLNWLYDREPTDEVLAKITNVQLRAQINGLERMNGTRIHTTDEMLKLASNFFEDLFSASDMGLDKRVFGLVEKQITDDINDFLLQQFTGEKIANAVKTMASLKAPGSDGFPAIFF
ncbi:hypothetical protein J1N35_039721 [Gossypium stocksii]|uniref:Uncharacterized protein n=1 Tax=Gossypium stocksii TaxID=47602 RepID=A0A9D3ZHX5_9ROSI|nr:hypothetical protein J1N35_039721 [Gossypium stocksii]